MPHVFEGVEVENCCKCGVLLPLVEFPTTVVNGKRYRRKVCGACIKMQQHFAYMKRKRSAKYIHYHRDMRRKYVEANRDKVLQQTRDSRKRQVLRKELLKHNLEAAKGNR